MTQTATHSSVTPPAPAAATTTVPRPAAQVRIPIWRQFYALTKPRVVQLIVFCALIGMLLATPGLPAPITVVAATAGIWLVAAAALSPLTRDELAGVEAIYEELIAPEVAGRW